MTYIKIVGADESEAEMLNIISHIQIYGMQILNIRLAIRENQEYSLLVELSEELPPGEAEHLMLEIL